jgi:hypothetical protein
VIITALISIAERVGANRIFRTEGRFHHPLGDPGLARDDEVRWRAELVRAAALMLTQPVDGPTVKDRAALVGR